MIGTHKEMRSTTGLTMPYPIVGSHNTSLQLGMLGFGGSIWTDGANNERAV
jgi:hypothetical protein